MNRRGLVLIVAGAVLTGLLWAEGGEKKTGRIIFASNRLGPGQWRIWTIRPDGSGLKQLTKGPSKIRDADPVFSPDGKSILLSSTRGGRRGVWRMSADGANLKRICDGDQAEWSPHGRKIALRRQGRIAVRDLASGKEKIITPADWTLCSGPAWSPDGKTIALARRKDNQNGIFTLPADGGKPTKLYDKRGACEPHFSPDGKRIVYETETRICTISPDGTHNRLVTHFGGVQRYARWSPDGKYLVYCQGASENGPWELYIIPSGGGTPRQLTRDESDIQPDWR